MLGYTFAVTTRSLLNWIHLQDVVNTHRQALAVLHAKEQLHQRTRQHEQASQEVEKYKALQNQLVDESTASSPRPAYLAHQTAQRITEVVAKHNQALEMQQRSRRLQQESVDEVTTHYHSLAQRLLRQQASASALKRATQELSKQREQRTEEAAIETLLAQRLRNAF